VKSSLKGQNVEYPAMVWGNGPMTRTSVARRLLAGGCASALKRTSVRVRLRPSERAMRLFGSPDARTLKASPGKTERTSLGAGQGRVSHEVL
jgi:hypothetical protein